MNIFRKVEVITFSHSCSCFPRQYVFKTLKPTMTACVSMLCAAQQLLEFTMYVAQCMLHGAQTPTCFLQTVWL